ncbi:MAG: TonB family protein [Thermoanaerobaculia bacterium]
MGTILPASGGPGFETSVSDILESRRRAGEPPKGLVAIISIAAHLSFLVFLAFLSRPRPLPFVPNHIPISIVSPAALGRPAPPAAVPVAQVPAPPAPVVAAPPKARPVIEKIQPEIVPSEKAMSLPKKTKDKPVKAAPVPAARPSMPSASPAVELPTSSGVPTGEATGTSNFGASVSAFDSDFPFAYYVEQLQSLIGANWLKPNVPDGTACVVAFQILKSGQVTDVRVETPSGLPYYDRAATRSLYAANPLPPLPPEFKGERLGVHLRFQ